MLPIQPIRIRRSEKIFHSEERLEVSESFLTRRRRRRRRRRRQPLIRRHLPIFSCKTTAFGCWYPVSFATY